MKQLTGSSIERASICAPSAALPTTASASGRASRGTTGHHFLHECLLYGVVDEALKRAAVGDRGWLGKIQTEKLPIDPKRYRGEIPFVYDVVTGEARELENVAHRDYGPLEASEIPCTLDVVTVAGIAGEVHDYKFQAGYDSGATAVSENWQLKFGGLAFARTYALESVTIYIHRIDDEGGVRSESFTMDTFALDEFEQDLERVYSRVESARIEVAHGISPKVTTGPHCRYCDAMPSCPGVKSIVLTRHEPGQLTPEIAGVAWLELLAIEEYAERRRKVLTDYAASTPLRLPDGRIVAAMEQSRETLDGAAVYDVIASLCDPKTARSAVELKATKTGIKAALGPVAKVRGVSLSELERDVMKAIRDAGGSRSSSFTTPKIMNARKAQED